MSQTYDMIVVGGGIVGSACARDCARSGLKTLLLDRGPIGGGTTAAGMGHVVVLDESEALTDLCVYSQGLWRDFAEEADDSIQWRERGTMWVAADDEEMRVAEAKHAFFQRKKLKSELADAAQLKALEPNLRDGLAGGLRVKSDAIVYPPSAARFLADQAAREGCVVSPRREVVDLGADGVVKTSDGETFSAGVVLNATGFWSPKLTPGIDVFMRKGHLVVTERYPEFASHQIIELGYTKSAADVSVDSVAFNLHPRADGKYLVGSSRQSEAFHTGVDYKILSRMLRRAMKYMPDLRNMWAQRCWTGFRPATRDKLPLIGPVPGKDRLWLATGHEGLGITTSLATGRLIASMATGAPCDISPEPYLPDRALKKGTTA